VKKRSDYQSFLLKTYLEKGISLTLLQGTNCEEEGRALKIIEEIIKVLNFEEISFDDIFNLIPHKK